MDQEHNLKIPVCHHFWKDGEYAVWQPPKFPIPEIENRVKADYDHLQSDKPPYKTYGNYTVFFAYKPGKDIFGRNITAISFAFVKDCKSSYEFCPIILPILKKSSFDTTFLNIRRSIFSLHKLSHTSPTFKYSTATIIVILIIIIIVFLQHKDINFSQAPDFSEKNNILPNIKLQPDDAFVIKPDIINKTVAPICTISQELDLYPCPRSYLEYYCGPWPEVNKSFKQWFEEAPECIQARRNLFSENLPLFRKLPTPEYQKLVKQILFDNIPKP